MTARGFVCNFPVPKSDEVLRRNIVPGRNWLVTGINGTDSSLDELAQTAPRCANLSPFIDTVICPPLTLRRSAGAAVGNRRTGLQR